MSMEELRSVIARNVRDEITAITERALISRIDHTGPPQFSSTGALLVMLAQGAKQLAIGEQVHTYRPGEALIAPLDLPMTGHFIEASPDSPSLGFSLALQPALIAELLLEPAATRLPFFGKHPAPPSGVMVFPVSDELVDAVTRLVGLAERPVDLPVLAPLIEREIHWLLLRGPHGETIRQLGLADSGLNRVGHAVRWLREHYAETVRVEDLARMSAMSASAFHRSFQQITALSPIQFQKQLRLQAARVRLLAEGDAVAAIAHEVGYESASQFSRDYRARFGAAPRDDVRSLRTPPARAAT